MKRLLILAGMLGIWANTATAAIFVTYTGTGFNPGLNLFDWTYSLTLQPDQNMRVGDFASIYDVPGIDGTPFFGSTNSNWSFGTTVQAIGLTPGGGPFPGEDGTDNVSVTLNGIVGGGTSINGNPAGGPTILGTLHILSLTDAKKTADWASVAEANGGDSITTGTTPVPARAIPEPGSLALMIVGLLFAGGFAVRRRQI